MGVQLLNLNAPCCLEDQGLPQVGRILHLSQTMVYIVTDICFKYAYDTYVDNARLRCLHGMTWWIHACTVWHDGLQPDTLLVVEHQLMLASRQMGKQRLSAMTR